MTRARAVASCSLALLESRVWFGSVSRKTRCTRVSRRKSRTVRCNACQTIADTTTIRIICKYPIINAARAVALPLSAPRLAALRRIDMCPSTTAAMPSGGMKAKMLNATAARAMRLWRIGPAFDGAAAKLFVDSIVRLLIYALARFGAKLWNNGYKPANYVIDLVWAVRVDHAVRVQAIDRGRRIGVFGGCEYRVPRVIRRSASFDAYLVMRLCDEGAQFVVGIERLADLVQSTSIALVGMRVEVLGLPGADHA